MKKRIFVTFLFAVILLFCGCELRTSDEMYAVPARPAADYNLQNAINKAMSGLDYAAPKSGTNQQIVQTADIDGNGDLEYLLFAKGDSVHPLQIFIFDKQKDENKTAILYFGSRANELTKKILDIKLDYDKEKNLLGFKIITDEFNDVNFVLYMKNKTLDIN